MSKARLRALASITLLATFAALDGACGDDQTTLPDAGLDAESDVAQPELDTGAPGPDAAADVDADANAPPPVCGNNKLEGDEECEDGNVVGGDGCDSACHLEPGWKCPTLGGPCAETRCGDGVKEGTEQCDNGKHDWSANCTPTCTALPSCVDGTCTPICGDGIVSAGEACDDGNNRSFDGCSATCKVEPGFTCTLIEAALPQKLTLPVVHRDFRGYDLFANGALPRGHIDFENKNGGHETGIVTALIGANGKPAYAKEGASSATTNGKAPFDQWFVDTPNINIPIVSTMELSLVAATSSYMFDSPSYFPIDDAGFVAANQEPTRPESVGAMRNFSFTTETHAWFEYKGTETITVSGDDDIWLFINGHLAVDLGGIHNALTGSVTLSQRANDLGLTVGKVFELALFRAERHTSGSSLKISVRPPPRSVCTN
jgi:fibro-slime domain-containing protein